MDVPVIDGSPCGTTTSSIGEVGGAGAIGARSIKNKLQHVCATASVRPPATYMPVIVSTAECPVRGVGAGPSLAMRTQRT